MKKVNIFKIIIGCSLFEKDVRDKEMEKTIE